MFDLYFVIRSVTYAQRGRDVLENAGIRCQLTRSPRSISPSGCAYALMTGRGNASAAMRTLAAAEIPFSGPFLRQRGGEFREMIV